MKLDGRIATVVKLLDMQTPGPIRLALVGMDGIGKTTLAKQVIIALRHQFDYTCFLELDNAQQKLKRELLIAENLYHHNGQRVRMVEGQQLLRGKNVLLIMDDVVSDEQISPFLMWNWCGEGSRLIITSSRHNWTPDFIVHEVPTLSDYASLALLKGHVEESVLKSIPKKLVSQVVHECDGLPLTLEVIGRYLRDKKEVTVWSGALEKLKMADSLDGDAGCNKIWRKLEVSFDNLGELEKKLLLDVATFDSYGPGRKRYDLNILKSAWGGGCDRIMKLVNVGLVNLEQRSLLRVERGYEWEKMCTLHRRGGIFIKKVRLHKQLQDMARWKSGPIKANLFSWRSLWRVQDIENMFAKWKGEKPQTQVLSVDLEQEISCAGFPGQDTNLRIQWSSLSRLDVLRFLRISNIHRVGHDLMFPESLVLLHMENCTKITPKKRKWVFWPDHDAWPLCGESIECLNALSVLILEKCSDVHLPENFHTLHRLKILKIDSGPLPMKPLSINFRLPSTLEHLSVNVPLKKLPNSLLQLPLLQSLELSGQNLEAWPIPTTVDMHSHLTALTRLELLYLPALAELPDSFGGMTSLKHLKVENCSALKKLPEGFGGLQQLSTLEIVSCNKLETLCESFSCLGMLVELQLRVLPSFWQLPTTFGYLPSLGELTMFGCSVTELPESFGNLQRLYNLNICCCDALESLWPSFGQHGFVPGLKQLKVLSVHYCKSFQGLPKSLEQLSLLTSLVVAGCEKFRYIPASLGQLMSLEELKLEGSARVATNSESGARWRDSLESLARISRLRILNWTNCETFPTSIGQLSLLKSLCLKDCKKFVGFPNSLAGLTALRCLEIDNCQTFTSLPEALGYLPSLVWLIISGCHDLVGLPDSICLLPSLHVLRIYDCENFTYLSGSVGQVTTLTELKIKNCRNLVTLPDSICHLLSLEELWILDCRQFENMLGELGQMTRLKELCFSSWNDLSPLLESFPQLEAIGVVVIKCMNCESTCLPEELGEIDSKILTHIDESCGCGCINVLDFLDYVEMDYLCIHTREFSVSNADYVSPWLDLHSLIPFRLNHNPAIFLSVGVVWRGVMNSEKEARLNSRCYDFLGVEEY